MWLLILVTMTGTVPDVYPLQVFIRYEECMVALHEVEFGIQDEGEAVLCLRARSEDQIRHHF